MVHVWLDQCMVELRCYLINSHKVSNNAWLTNCDAYHEVGGELWMLG